MKKIIESNNQGHEEYFHESKNLYGYVIVVTVVTHALKALVKSSHN